MDDISRRLESLLNAAGKRTANAAGKQPANAASKQPAPPSPGRILVYITRDGTYIALEGCPKSVQARIRACFTIKDTMITGAVRTTTQYTACMGRLLIPRFGAFLLRQKFDVEYHCAMRLRNPAPLSYKGEFHGNQELVFNEIMSKHMTAERRDAGRAGLILNLKAGMGKSFLAMELIGHLKCRTLIIVHNKNILHQWEELVEEWLAHDVPSCADGVPSARDAPSLVGVYYGDRKRDGAVVIGVINSLVSMDPVAAREFFARFDMTILDEAHLYCSKEHSKIYSICQTPYMLGLSASPENRADNLDRITKWGIGPVLNAAELPGYTEAHIPFKGEVHQIQYHGPDEYTQQIISVKLEMVSAPMMVDQFTRDPYRTALVVRETLALWGMGHNVFVFADRREYLTEIAEGLTAGQQATQPAGQPAIFESSKTIRFLTNHEELKAIRLVGGSTAAEMEEAKACGNIILTTYQYMGTGCSIPKMNAMVLATPRKTGSEQTINRIFRLGSDYSITRRIVDIVDWRTSLKRQWYERNAYYKSQKFELIKRVVKWSELADDVHPR